MGWVDKWEREKKKERGEEMRWGTLEELVLGSAVERHGTHNWDLVSSELEARFRRGFSPEACMAKYDALQGRFNARASCDGVAWLLEELRRLRVAHLRRELQRSDDSIGSLQTKLEMLQAERTQGLKERSGVATGGGGDGGGGGVSKPCSEGEGDVEVKSKDRSSAGSFTKMAVPEAVEISPKHETGTDMGDGIDSAQRCDERDRESNPLPARENYEERSAPAPVPVPVPARATASGSPNRDGDPDQGQQYKVAASVSEGQGQVVVAATEEAPPSPPPPLPVHPTSPLDSFYGSSETLADEENRKVAHDYAESKISDIEGGRLRADLVERRGNLRYRQRCRRPRSNKQPKAKAPAEESNGEKEDIKRAAPNDFRRSPPESVPAEKSEADRDQDQDRTSVGYTENSGLQTVETNSSQKSSGPVRKRKRSEEGNKGSAGPRAANDVHSETSSHGDEEDSAESMDTQHVTKDRDLHKGGGGAGLPMDSDVLSAVNAVEMPREGAKASSTSSGHGRYKECEEYTRSSGDSHMDRPGSGSHMEGTDEIEASPMSRRSRREPKVPGKLLPLLECLRSICSHKFGSLFKHRHENQTKQQYRNMIRRHMDLGMVRARLEEGSYSGSLDFFRDVLLVFNNALVYYSKTSQEYAAAWVLRQLATKEMENIFKTEALLKQDGPSTRKREPRKASESTNSLANAVKFNPSSLGVGRKRNTTSPNTAAGLLKAPRLNFQQFPPHKDEDAHETIKEDGKSEDVKEAIEVSTSAPQRLESEAANLKKINKDGPRVLAQATKIRDDNTGPPKTTSGSSIQPKKSNTSFDSEATRNTSVHESITGPKKPFGSIVHRNRATKKEPQQQIILPSEHPPTPVEQESEPPPTGHEQRHPPPPKRGVGRPPKHAKKAAAYSQARDSEPPSKSRKKARR